MSREDLTPFDEQAARNTFIETWMAQEKAAREEFRKEVQALDDETLYNRAAAAYQMLELEGWSRAAVYYTELIERSMKHPPRNPDNNFIDQY